jgi:hypothetical protein
MADVDVESLDRLRTLLQRVAPSASPIAARVSSRSRSSQEELAPRVRHNNLVVNVRRMRSPGHHRFHVPLPVTLDAADDSAAWRRYCDGVDGVGGADRCRNVHLVSQRSTTADAASQAVAPVVSLSTQTERFADYVPPSRAARRLRAAATAKRDTSALFDVQAARLFAERLGNVHVHRPVSNTSFMRAPKSSVCCSRSTTLSRHHHMSISTNVHGCGS